MADFEEVSDRTYGAIPTAQTLLSALAAMTLPTAIPWEYPASYKASAGSTSSQDPSKSKRPTN
jgi:hypothetical protein